MGNEPRARRRSRRRTRLPTDPDGSHRGCERRPAKPRRRQGELGRSPTPNARGRSRRHDSSWSTTLTVFDAQAIVAFLLEEPAAADVEHELRDPARLAHLSALNLAEVVDVMARIYGKSHSETTGALILLESGGLQIAGIDAAIGASAGALHARHYDRKTSPLSMADCVALATAAALGEPLATSDPPLAAAAQAEGVTVIGLPDANGRRPAS